MRDAVRVPCPAFGRWEGLCSSLPGYSRAVNRGGIAIGRGGLREVPPVFTYPGYLRPHPTPTAFIVQGGAT